MKKKKKKIRAEPVTAWQWCQEPVKAFQANSCKQANSSQQADGCWWRTNIHFSWRNPYPTLKLEDISAGRLLVSQPKFQTWDLKNSCKGAQLLNLLGGLHTHTHIFTKESSLVSWVRGGFIFTLAYPSEAVSRRCGAAGPPRVNCLLSAALTEVEVNYECKQRCGMQAIWSAPGRA